MNGFHTRSALVRQAEYGLGVRHRPREARDIVSAINPIPQPDLQTERDERRQRESAVAVAVCVMVIGIYLLVEFMAQVLQ